MTVLVTVSAHNGTLPTEEYLSKDRSCSFLGFRTMGFLQMNHCVFPWTAFQHCRRQSNTAKAKPTLPALMQHYCELWCIPSSLGPTKATPTTVRSPPPTHEAHPPPPHSYASPSMIYTTSLQQTLSLTKACSPRKPGFLYRENCTAHEMHNPLSQRRYLRTEFGLAFA